MTVVLLFLRKHWLALVLAISACLVVYVAYDRGVTAGEAAVQAQWKADIAERTRAQAAEKLKLETAYEERFKTAVAARDAQIKRVQADADGARAAVGSLRQQLAAGRGRVTQAAPAAVVDYADAVADVLGECAAEYQRVAEKADGHAADAAALMQAWPQ